MGRPSVFKPYIFYGCGFSEFKKVRPKLHFLENFISGFPETYALDSATNPITLPHTQEMGKENMLNKELKRSIIGLKEGTGFL